MKKLLQILLLFIVTSSLFAQREEASIWYFGERAGMHFNLITNSATVLKNGKLDTREGSTSISDSSGRLLFYTDGHTVWNRNHFRMSGGWFLSGETSNTQPALIVPKPDDANIYYIFTTSLSNGLDYAIVDMTRDNGLGAVINQDINLLPFGTQMITAVAKNCADKSIWVTAFSYGTLYTFEVNNLGVSSTFSTFPMNYSTLLDFDPNFGYLKFSPDGTKLACSSRAQGVFLYDFDADSGIISNEKKLDYNAPGSSFSAHGLEFSSNSQILYVSMFNDYVSQNEDNNNNPSNHLSSLLQFDLSSATILASNPSSPLVLPPKVVAPQYVVENDKQLYRNGLQLATNGKIYRASSSIYGKGTTFLGVINNPNEFGPGCNYQDNAVNLSPKISGIATPTFIQTFFRTHFDIIKNDLSTLYLSLCSGETYTLTADDVPGATYTWTLDGNLLPESDYDLVVSQPGHYEVIMDMNNGYCPVKGQAHITYYQTPIANTPNNLTACSKKNGIASFDFSLQTNDVYGGQDPTQFSVTYHRSQFNADNNTNEILGLFENTESPQEIFVRIENNDFTDCYDTTSFFIEVFNAQIQNTLKDLYVCDNDDDGDNMNGQVTIDLQLFNSNVSVLGNQNVSDFIVSYYSSEADAISGANPLPNLYYNQTPYSEEIFVRVENKQDTRCFDTGSFTFNVTMPDAFNATLVQCEDDTPDGLSVFNLNESFLSLTGGAPNRSTKFFSSLSDAQGSLNEIQDNIFYNSTNPQIVYAQVIDEISGCFNVSELTLQVGLTDSNDVEFIVCDDDNIEDGIYNFNLNKIQGNILNGLPIGLDVSFYETFNDALLEENTILRTYRNTTPYNQIIYARVENGNDCYGISEVSLIINKLPNLEIEETVYYCLNKFPETITVNAGIKEGTPTDYSYNWSTGDNTYEIEINEVGVYTVIVTNSDGCDKQRKIVIEPSNTATIENIEVVDASKNNIITVLVSGEGIYEYQLVNEDNGNTTSYQESNHFQNVFPGIYSVNVRDTKNNCGIIDNQISVIGFPKFFTPNNDGVNDTWHIYGVTAALQPNSKVLIFDRYGNLLKQLKPSEKGWDGLINGKKLPTDDYWFIATLGDGRIFKNHFTLKY